MRSIYAPIITESEAKNLCLKYLQSRADCEPSFIEAFRELLDIKNNIETEWSLSVKVEPHLRRFSWTADSHKFYILQKYWTQTTYYYDESTDTKKMMHSSENYYREIFADMSEFKIHKDDAYTQRDVAKKSARIIIDKPDIIKESEENELIEKQKRETNIDSLATKYLESKKLLDLDSKVYNVECIWTTTIEYFPTYIIPVEYQRRIYVFYVDGLTGEVKGDFPQSNIFHELNNKLMIKDKRNYIITMVVNAITLLVNLYFFANSIILFDYYLKKIHGYIFLLGLLLLVFLFLMLKIYRKSLKKVRHFHEEKYEFLLKNGMAIDIAYESALAQKPVLSYILTGISLFVGFSFCLIVLATMTSGIYRSEEYKAYLLELLSLKSPLLELIRASLQK